MLTSDQARSLMELCTETTALTSCALGCQPFRRMALKNTRSLGYLQSAGKPISVASKICTGFAHVIVQNFHSRYGLAFLQQCNLEEGKGGGVRELTSKNHRSAADMKASHPQLHSQAQRYYTWHEDTRRLPLAKELRQGCHFL